jgi:hypothetical protein
MATATGAASNGDGNLEGNSDCDEGDRQEESNGEGSKSVGDGDESGKQRQQRG